MSAINTAVLPAVAGPRPRRATRCVALAAVVLSCSLPRTGRYFPWEFNDAMIALVALVTSLVIEEGWLPGLGLYRTPELGWWYWCRFAVWLGFSIGIVLVISNGVLWLMGWRVHVYRFPPDNLTGRFFMMCVYFPLVEEIIYRSLLRVAVESSLGGTGTIVVSGVVFALVHILRGNASPENQIAGFLLAWAFLRSRTILVPVAMHSAGNSVALISQIAAWYWAPENSH